VLFWHGGEQIGFIVDEILDEREVLVKDWQQLRRVRNIAGPRCLAREGFTCAQRCRLNAIGGEHGTRRCSS